MRQFLIWDDFASYRGNGFFTRPHSHFFIQITLPDSGTVELRTRGGAWQAYRAAFIPSALNHEMRQVEGDMTLLFLHPLTLGLQHFGNRGLASNEAILELSAIAGEKVTDQIRSILQAPGKEARGQILQLLHGRAPDESIRVIDKRIAQSIQNADPEDFSLSRLSAEAGLSTGRFRHLFRQETGIPFSAYRLWLKTKAAVHQLATRPDLVAAAYEGKFSDQAHFSRIFRRSFGIYPSDFTKGAAPFTAFFYSA